MFSELKQVLRRHLLGWRFQHNLQEDHRTLSRLGNRYYIQNPGELLAPGFTPPVNAYEFSHYSQNGEDGILLHLLERLGVENRYIVEVGTEDGRECNSANLILNFGWSGCLIEASESSAAAAREYFSACRVLDRVHLINAWALPGNINELLRNAGVPGTVDILSIDIDSHDYWLWRALDCLNPRIVVIEYNASFSPDSCVTVPYPMPRIKGKAARYYHGASLMAMQQLGREKGYTMVGGDSRGINCFFVRNDLAAAAGLTAVSTESAYRPHFWRSLKQSPAEQYRITAGLPLAKVD